MREYILYPGRISLRKNCHDRYEPLVKFKGNPVFYNEKPWEGRVAWPTMLYIADEKIYKMWYLAIVEGEEDPGEKLVIDNAVVKKNKFYICYAESADGIKWTRPVLNNIKVEKYPDNNIVFENKGRYIDGASVVYDSTDSNQSRRYKMAFYEQYGGEQGVRTMVSPDGINWREEGKFPVLPSQDALKMYHDVKNGTFYIFLKDRILNRRSRLVTSSDDFINWSEPYEILSPNLGDDESTNFYDMCAFENGDTTMALITVFDASTQFSHSELVLAGPGMTIKRMPSRPAVLRPGDLGTWDGGGVYTSGSGPMEVNGKMRYYYYGSSGRHDSYLFEEKYKKIIGNDVPKSSFGIAEYDKGRLCGQQFLGEGMLITTAIKKSGKKLYVDAVAPDSLKIAITRTGYPEPYEGFKCDDCCSITGDGLFEVTWKDGKGLEDIDSEYIRIMAEGKNSVIYGFRIE